MDLFAPIDPRLQAALRAELERRATEAVEAIPHGMPVVLVGHRAAGKSSLLRPLAQRLGLPAVDLDAALEERHGRPLRSWLVEDLAGFRAAERALLEELLRKQHVIAAGGGVLSLHASALVGALPVLVPITFETYVERLRADTARPRLRPELSLTEELRAVFSEREQLHAQVRTVGLVELLLRHAAGRRARRLVTLPPGEAPHAFALRARAAGAELLEVRTDLTPLQTDLSAAARVLPLLVAERGAPVPSAWSALATLVDREDPAHAARALAWRAGGVVNASGGASSPAGAAPSLHSFHAPAPLETEEALAAWADSPAGAQVKHVEPLGPLHTFGRLLATQAALLARFGEGRVTVLATGPLALPFRAVLAQHNALDYLALDGQFAAAPGQRLLRDAVREAKAPRGAARLGILGARIQGSRSPSIHPQPFDRIDLPPEAPIAELVEALRPHYRGFAVTSPFKKPLAQWLGFDGGALNTLWRTAEGFRGDNTDVAGALRTLESLESHVTVPGDGVSAGALRTAETLQGPNTVPGDGGAAGALRTAETLQGANAVLGDGGAPGALRTAETLQGANTVLGDGGAAGARRAQESLHRAVTVLGDGGAAVALRQAASQRGTPLTVLRWQQALGARVEGLAVWTWPPHLGAPDGLRFEGSPVAVIAYGAAGKAIAQLIRACGGAPVRLGARWFIAQARAQRTRWETAR